MLQRSTNLWTCMLLLALIGPSSSLRCKHCSDGHDKIPPRLKECEELAETKDFYEKKNILRTCKAIEHFYEITPKCSQPEFWDCEKSFEAIQNLRDDIRGRTTLLENLGRRGDGPMDKACSKIVLEEETVYACTPRGNTDECEFKDEGSICFCDTDECEPKGSGSFKMPSWLLALICVSLSLAQIMASTDHGRWLD